MSTGCKADGRRGGGGSPTVSLLEAVSGGSEISTDAAISAAETVRNCGSLSAALLIRFGRTRSVPKRSCNKKTTLFHESTSFHQKRKERLSLLLCVPE